MSETLKPWYAVATPHEDIRERRLAEAVFAANVWAVVQDTALEVYLGPEEFFRKTYLTTGLSTVLNRVAGALRGAGENGDHIGSLQTAFGGGTACTLVASCGLAEHATRAPWGDARSAVPCRSRAGEKSSVASSALRRG
jgi:hypothetical protein